MEKEIIAMIMKEYAKKRWKKTTKSQRREHAYKMLAARKDRRDKISTG